MTTETEKNLWNAADQLRANSRLKSSEYSVPVLGLIFLRFADYKFTVAKQEIEKHRMSSRRGITKADYQAKGVLYLPENARFSYLLNLPEGENIGKAINDAMKAIEMENEDLKDVLPKTYIRLENDVLVALLKIFSGITMTLEGDVFGKIYEYFLGKFAMAEGQRGGEFFTPTSLVKLIVEVIEPYHGRIYDPACGSGGMFVQSANFVERHKKNPSTEISIYGQEKTAETVRLCKMNLAVHGLSGDIRQGNTYYQDFHSSFGKFDFVMANPPFNVNGVDNFFYTVTLPCTLWFFDKEHTNRKDNVLFIDARGLYQQIDRAHREFTPEQIVFIANIVRLYREEPIETDKGSQKLMEQYFPAGEYRDIPGLCNVATIEEIIDQGYSLNPGRYVGVAEREEEDFVFSERLHALNEELGRLNIEAHELEEKIAENVVTILEERPNE